MKFLYLICFLLSSDYMYGAFGLEKVKPGLIGDEESTLSAATIDLMVYLLGFLALIAVIWIMKAGFGILTAGGDEEKVKKGKNTILFVLIGAIVIWAAWALISGVMFTLENGN